MPETTPSPTRVLLIGCGGIVNAAHLHAFRDHPERIRLVAACDPSEPARQAVARNCPHRYPVQTEADYETAISKYAKEVDAALVTTPHFLHYPQASACVEAGIPVLVEKPVCRNLDETRRLMSLARERQVLVVAGQNRRYERPVLWARRWIREDPDNFGELRSFDLRGWQNIEAWIATKPDKTADFWILDKERAGGGVVVSLLIHQMDLVRHLSGHDFVEVSAQGRFEKPFRNGAESSCCALMKLSNGAVGTLHANYLVKKSFPPNEVINLIGDHGYVGNEQGWKYGSGHGTEPDGWDWQFDGIGPVPEDESLTPDPRSFTSQLLAFADAVRNGTKPFSHIEENFNTMAAIEAIYTSMRNGGKTVPVAKF
jgi:predicted dehydrogenase